MEQIRQTDEGSLLLGGSWEDAGYDPGTTHDVMAGIARAAIECFPFLDSVRIVRSWGALRILAPDRGPIYEAIDGHANAFLATCHSGVSLASNHALEVANWIVDGVIPEHARAFSLGRFSTARP